MRITGELDDDLEEQNQRVRHMKILHGDFRDEFNQKFFQNLRVSSFTTK